MHSQDLNECLQKELSCSNVARSTLRGSSVRVNCPGKVYARVHVSISATYLFSLVDLSYDYFYDFFAFDYEDGHKVIS